MLSVLSASRFDHQNSSISYLGNDPKMEMFSDSSFEIPKSNFFCAQRVASSGRLFFKQGAFWIIVDGKTHKIHTYDVQGLPHTLKKEQLSLFLQQGYFALEKRGEDFGLTAKVRILGGDKRAQAKAEYNRRMEALKKTQKDHSNSAIWGEVWREESARIRREVRAHHGVDGW